MRCLDGLGFVAFVGPTLLFFSILSVRQARRMYFARDHEQKVSTGSDKVGQFPIALIVGGSDKNKEESI